MLPIRYSLAGGRSGRCRASCCETLKFQAIETVARVRLALLDAATSLADLKLPGVHLEALKRDHKGQYSIRINDQFRICFNWKDGDVHNVVDYH
ncbi:MAG: type II toxin-antitoxin system RelE/ParE family toxin [Bryobacterales bacterium]|nr:type II toxin-antitoxin system RelE/ParE family toxin [Bryobacterales bacterium]